MQNLRGLLADPSLVIMVSINRMKKRAILHGANVQEVEACKEKVDVENVLRKLLRKKQDELAKEEANGDSQ